ncbi:MAG: hypothetical protein MR867_04080 [Eubacterium sp.]|nr:hypothetical protein [Eubacterium sp.]MDD7210432.1 hypothetical protein [Lachnospiraceae bacterium]MDY5498071.1 hypothetical protein [Anaerobutyricum sp.]
MQDKNSANIIKIVTEDFEAVTVMMSTPVETVKSILGRLGVEYEQGLPKEVYITALKEEFCSDPKWILMMLPAVVLDFLMEVWENDTVEMDEERWNYIEYLKVFGLLNYRRKYAVAGTEDEIIVVPAMKEQFYFLLKSRKSQKLIATYEEWDKYLTGLMYYYGLIELTDLFVIFQKTIKKMISFEEFLIFLKCRCSLWSFGVILKDISGDRQYFQCMTVENPDLLLTFLREHPGLFYKEPSPEDLIYISESAGIDNRWPGVSELGTLFVEKLGLNYYRATVAVKTLIIMVQNGCSFEKLRDEVTVIVADPEEWEKEVTGAVRDLYENVPIFEYKGHSRKEYRKLFHERQLRKRKERFTIIEGGRH